MKKKSNIYLEPGMTETEYKAIQKEWYSKLKQSGFEDIESFDSKGVPNDLMKTDVRIDYSKDPSINQARQDYYRFASQFVYDNVWESVFDKTVWDLHSEGKTEREILESFKPAKIGKTSIHNSIKRTLELFKDYVKTRDQESK